MFFQVGDKVQKGQVVCIIEAMKLMNEIEVCICFIFYPVCSNSSVSFPLCILILLLPFLTVCCSLARICENSSSPYVTSHIYTPPIGPNMGTPGNISCFSFSHVSQLLQPSLPLITTLLFLQGQGQ